MVTICFRLANVNALSVLPPQGQEFRAMSIVIHQLYQIRASAYDIALVKISPMPQLTPQLNTICLALIPPPTHQICVVAGWGRMQENGEKSSVLREIHIPIVSAAVCNDLRHYAGLVNLLFERID